MKWTILNLLKWTEDYFKKFEVPNPRLDAELLLGHLLNKKRLELYLEFDRPMSQGELTQYKALISRRARREPLQYIIGTQEFWSMTFKVTPDVLIPRQETEHIIERAIKLFSKELSLKILDIGTGSGAIAAALAKEFPNSSITATDVSEKALAIAGENIKNFEKQISLISGDLFENITQRDFDLIVSNPPYINPDDKTKLQPEIANFEPADALFAKDRGLEIIKKIINNAHNYLAPKGFLIMEFGEKQKDEILNLIKETNKYTNVYSNKDHAGLDRIIEAQTMTT